MRVDLFDYDLPTELIAQRPIEPRDAARLLHVGSNGPHDRAVRDLPDLLRRGDLLVVNDTKVLPVRFAAQAGASSIEVTLTEAQGDRTWLAYLKPGRKVRAGDDLTLAPGLHAVCIAKEDDGRGRLRFDLAGEELMAAVRASGAVPLPPYIKRAGSNDAADREAYQTLFAEHEGAIAAPTAGLHFTPDLVRRLEDAGVRTAKLTLHVGLGTFRPVKAETVEDHAMHAERYEVPAATAEAYIATKAAGGRVVAVGTTVLRTLEAAFDRETGSLRPGPGETRLFIYPGYAVRTADLLLTNFHLPRSTLLMLVSAFAGYDAVRNAYAHAVAERYRFFSYGDACLFERAP